MFSLRGYSVSYYAVLAHQRAVQIVGACLKIYEIPRSGNCHRARLMLHFLKLSYESIEVDLGGETNDPWYLALNPRATVPVLNDDGVLIWDSHAIITYLAEKYAPEWIPHDPVSRAEIATWMGVAQGEIHYGIFRARSVFLHNRPWDLAQCQELGRKGLALLDQRLDGREWLVGDRITVADISCYPYVSLAPEGEIFLDEFKNVTAWVDRIRSKPNYIELPPMPAV